MDDAVSPDEIILRRIPPTKDGGPQFKQRLPDGSWRATSFSLMPRSGEQYLSWTRLAITSPRELLELLRNQGIAPEGWDVCRLLVADARALGFSLSPDPTVEDQGHTLMEGAFEIRNRVSQLAKRTRILSPMELETLKAGDALQS